MKCHDLRAPREAVPERLRTTSGPQAFTVCGHKIQRTRLVGLTSTPLLLAILGGCDEPIKEPQHVEDNRVLGARIQALADPDRAQVAPGESATIDWLVADPEPGRAIGWAFGVCPAVDASSGLPRCAAPFFAQTASSEPRPEAPRFDFTLPATAQIGDRVVVLGVVCAGAQPILGGSYWDAGCSEIGAKRTVVSFYVRVLGAGEANHNPDLSTAGHFWDGTPWIEPAAEALLDADCARAPSEVPRVPAGSRGHLLDVMVAEDDRELLAQESSIDPARETLLFSHFATAGELERAYSTLDPDQPTTPIQVRWDAPVTVAATGLLVRFYLVLRDLRGGVDFVTRAVCVMPK